MIGSIVYSEIQNRTLHDERNFFGTLSVRFDLAKRNNSISLRMVDGEHNPVTGKDPSEWLVMARIHRHSTASPQKSNWGLLEGRAESVAWTDDFSNILSVFRWY
jgi:hypothetical protein